MSTRLSGDELTLARSVARTSARPSLASATETIVRNDVVPYEHRALVARLADECGATVRPAGGGEDGLRVHEAEPVALMGDHEYVFPIGSLD